MTEIIEDLDKLLAEALKISHLEKPEPLKTTATVFRDLVDTHFRHVGGAAIPVQPFTLHGVPVEVVFPPISLSLAKKALQEYYSSKSNVSLEHWPHSYYKYKVLCGDRIVAHCVDKEEGELVLKALQALP